MRLRKLDPRGEMPFLEHLEELRWRILWSLAAVLVGTVLGFWAVQHFDLVALLKRPIAPYLPASGKLYYTHPTDAFIVIFKLSLIVGMILASPIIIWQAWAFFSPALYQREKKYIIPLLFGGLILFLAGVLLAYGFVLPAAFKIFLGFQPTDFEPIITADNYFGFAVQLILAFGLAFELPLVIMLLAMFGVVTPKFLSENRRYWVVIAAVAAAVITPTPDALTMLVMMVPLLFLYELGIVLARMVARRRSEEDAGAGAGTTVAIVALLLGMSLAAPARAQVPNQPPPRPPGVQDTTRGAIPPGGQPIDTAAARRLGLPTAPSHSIPQPDSVIQALMQKKGFQLTRFTADSLTFHADTKKIDLKGKALVEKEGSTLEADSVRFAQAQCRIDAEGEPKLFQQGTVLVGEGMQYDTCLRRGTVSSALTKFNQSGVDWWIRGRLSIDSASSRIYAGGSSITSSDLPLPDYHFAAGRVKWVSNTIMVARPTVLYVRDVPVLWLPFIFQDMRKGRRSGILVPRFGINDLIRSNPGYHRHISNVGYYVVFNDYVDAQAALEWYAGTSVAVNGQIQYRWLNQFVNGSASLTRMWETGTGNKSLRLAWNHQQQFNLRTRLSANIDYATSTRILQRNSANPDLVTATLHSAGTFSKQFSWGQFQVGGDRSQELSSGTVRLLLPSVTLSPAPIDLSSGVTWSPSFSVSNNLTTHQPAGVLAGPPVSGIPTSDSIFASNRTTQVTLGSPFRIGRFNLPLNVSATDTRNQARSQVQVPDPEDSTRKVTRFYGEDFRTEIEWNPTLTLPTLFASTWKLQPSIGVANSTGGSFILRNQYTGGKFVTQGKRASFGAQISPTLFGFFPGFGPLARIRHSISPSVHWNFAPGASVPEAYARAISPTGAVALKSPRTHSIGFGLNQTFEGKFRPAPGDTNATQQARKIKLLSLQSSGFDYDFEQAKLPGRSGWKTSTFNNTFTSDLLPGFSLATTHDLWRGTVGYDTAKFDPFLTNVSARFSVTGATFRGLAAMLTGKSTVPASSQTPDTSIHGVPARMTTPINPGPGGFDRFGGGAPQGGALHKPFTAAVSYNDTRVRPTDLVLTSQPANRTLGLGIAFSPTPGWSVSWDTEYNLTTKEFGQHVLRLERDLRRWRATFGFMKSPNGNFQFDFYVSLLDQQDIKFQYGQQTVNR